MNQRPALVTMRYADMTRVHPRQDNSRSCHRCHCRLGIYPSGQRALKADPGIEIICTHCARAEAAQVKIDPRLAGTIEDFLRESRESGPKFDA